MKADLIATKFTDFGDFNIFKDHQDSCYIEFYFFDTSSGVSSLQEFIDVINERKKEFGVELIVPYSEAVKFKAHDRLE